MGNIVKHQLGKLPLPGAADDFIKHQCAKHFVEYLSLDEKAVFNLGSATHVMLARKENHDYFG
jgi:PIN domain nuclease of toxin-antitoxin system